MAVLLKSEERKIGGPWNLFSFCEDANFYTVWESILRSKKWLGVLKAYFSEDDKKIIRME